jgi:hypothetical protein
VGPRECTDKPLDQKEEHHFLFALRVIHLARVVRVKIVTVRAGQIAKKRSLFQVVFSFLNLMKLLTYFVLIFQKIFYLDYFKSTNGKLVLTLCTGINIT